MLLHGPVDGEDGVVQRGRGILAGRGVRDDRVRRDVECRSAEELLRGGLVVLQLHDEGRVEAPEPLDLHLVVEGEDVGKERVLPVGLNQDNAVLVDDLDVHPLLRLIDPADDDLEGVSGLEGFQKGEGVSILDSSALESEDKGLVSGAVGDVGSRQVVPGHTEQDRVDGRAGVACEVRGPLGTHPCVLLSVRTPVGGEGVGGGLLPSDIDTTQGLLPLRVDVLHRHDRSGGYASLGDRVVAGMVDVERLPAVDGVEVDLVDMNGAAILVSEVHVERDDSARVRLRLRLPEGRRHVIDSSGGVPVLDERGDDVTEGVLLLLDLLDTVTTVVDVALDEGVLHAERVRESGAVVFALHPNLDGLSDDGVDPGLVLVPGLPLGAREGESERDSLTVENLPPVVGAVPVPNLDPRRLPEELCAELRHRERNLEVDGDGLDGLIPGVARLRQPETSVVVEDDVVVLDGHGLTTDHLLQ